MKLLVVKSGYLPPELAPRTKPNLMALTKGVVNQDIAHLSNQNRTKATLPFGPNETYTPVPQPSTRFARQS